MTEPILTSDIPQDNSTTRRHRSRFRYLVWAVGILVIGGMLVAAMLPSLCRSSETANRVKCASNLRQLGQAIMIYVQDHGGQYPTSLAVLPLAADIGAGAMVCPSSNDEMSIAKGTDDIVAELTAAETNAAGHKNCMSYVYTGRALTQKTATATDVVAYEPLQNHDGDGTNVLFGDGHVEFISKDYWVKIAGDAGIEMVTGVSRDDTIGSPRF